MFNLIFVFLIDPDCLSRPNYEMLDEQTLMELTINHIEKKEKFIDTSVEYTDIKDWQGLEVDDEGNVKKINFKQKHYGGTISFEWIPQFVTKIDFSENNFQGTIETKLLKTFNNREH